MTTKTLTPEDLSYLLSTHTRMVEQLAKQYFTGELSRAEYRRKVREEITKTMNGMARWPHGIEEQV